MARSGGRGPVPRRSNERRRRNKDGEAQSVTVAGQVKVPPLPKHIHPIARRWYRSLRESGQSQYFEPSDWADALYVAEAMTRNLEAPRFSSELFGKVQDAMDRLLTTQAARLRARIQVERDMGEAQTEGNVTAIDEYRKQLGA